MPITRELTPEELKSVEAQGLDPSLYAGKKVTLATDEELGQQKSPQVTNPSYSTLGAIGKSLQQKTGSIIGGGGAALGTGLLLAPFTEGASLIPSLLGLVGIGTAAGAGSYVGQRGQNTLQGPQVTQQLEQEATQAHSEHPIATTVGDITANALASGGSFSPSTAISGTRGILAKLTGQALTKEMARDAANVAIQSGVMPAINTGLSLAQGQGIPSIGSLAEQAVGGALFAKPSKLGEMFGGRKGQVEDPNKGETTAKPEVTEPTAKPVESPYLQTGDNGQHVIDNATVRALWLKANPKPIPSEGVDPLLDTDYHKANVAWKNQSKDTDLQRQWAQDAWVKKYEESKVIQAQTPTDQPIVKTPDQGVSNEPTKSVDADTSTPKLPVANDSADVNQLRGQDFLKQEADRVANEKKSEDYQKMQEELAAQKSAEVVQSGREPLLDQLQQSAGEQPKPIEQVAKPLNKNAMGIVNTKTLLPNDVARPQTPLPIKDATEMGVDQNRYAPPSDYDLYKDNNDKMRDLVKSGQHDTPDFFKMFQSNEDIKNRQPGDRKGKPPLEPTNSTIIPKTVGDLLNHVVAGKSENSDFAKELLSKIDQSSLKTPVEQTLASRNHYTPEGTVKLTDTASESEALHEVIHAATSKKVDELGPNHPLVKELQSLLETARQHIADKNTYGLKDVHEFMAEAKTNKEFSKTLEGIKDGPTTLWGKFTDIVRRMFGIDSKHSSLMERVLKPTDELMQMERPGSSKEIKIGDTVTSIDPKNGKKLPDGKVIRKEVDGSLLVRISKGASFDNYFFPGGKGVSLSGENRFAPPSKGTKEEIERPYQLHLTEATLDRIRDHPNPLGKVLADRSQLALQGTQEQMGWTQNALQSKIRDVKLTTSDQTHLEQIRNYDNLHHKLPDNPFQNDRQRIAWETERGIYKKMGEERLKENEPVMRGNTPTNLKIDEHSHPTTLDDKYSEMLRKGTDTVGIKNFSDKYVEYAMKQGYSLKEAQESLTNLRESIQGSMKNESGNMQYFNAVRRSQGVNLPPEFIKKGWAQNLETYYNRSARDMNFYKFVEKNPQAMSALGMTRDSWMKPIPKDPLGGIANDSSVKTLIQEFRGNRSTSGERTEEAASALATKIFIANPGLQAHVIGSNTIGMVSAGENPYQMGKILTGAFKNITSGFQHAVENGVYKYSAKSSMDMLDSSLTWAQRFQGLSRFIGQISTLNDLTTKFNAAFLQAGCEVTIDHKLNLASSGDKTAMQFIKKLDPTYASDRVYSPVEKTKLASTAVGFIHGTGDARTMPPWMLNDSELSGFFTLAHWSVAQTNKFMTDFYTPARNGNILPLANAMFGAAIGGYFVKKLREEISGRKPQLPSLPEIAAGKDGLAGNKGLVLYNMIAGMQYAGFGGLLSQVAKYPFDIAYKNTPMGAVFPMDELATNTFDMVKDLTTAATNDPHFNWGHAAMYVAQHIATDSFQLGRIGYNQAINHGLITGEMAEKRELANKLGQLRRFNMVSNLPYDEVNEGSNPFMNLEQKSFKLEQDPQKAMAMLPGLINTIVTKYGENPDVMMEKLKALKQNSYSTMPSLETMPLSFMKYVAYLDRLEGPGKGQEAMMDFMKHKVVNEAKASVVP